jgi:hypothetical protein
MFGKGGPTRNSEELRLCRTSTTVDFAVIDRLVSLTRRGCQFASSVVLWALPSGLLAICSRDRCNLNYSFFGLRLCPYE